MFTLPQIRTVTTNINLTEPEAKYIALEYLYSLVGGRDASISKAGFLEKEVEDRGGSHSSWSTVKIRKATEDDEAVFAAIDTLQRKKS